MLCWRGCHAPLQIHYNESRTRQLVWSSNFVFVTIYVTPALKQRHWLPVARRIKFKLFLFVHLIYLGRAPQYLVDCVQLVVSDTWDRLIQQTTLNALQVLSSASVASATLDQRHGTPFHHIFVPVRLLTLTRLKRHLKSFCSPCLFHRFVSAPVKAV